jgi:hypothetical protein
MNADGTNVARLTNNWGYERNPDWQRWTFAPHVVITIEQGPMSDASVIYENGVQVRTITANTIVATPSPNPTAIPSVSPTMMPSLVPTPTTTPGPSATPTAGSGMDVGLVIGMFAVIGVAAVGAYYLFRKK